MLVHSEAWRKLKGNYYNAVAKENFQLQSEYFLLHQRTRSQSPQDISPITRVTSSPITRMYRHTPKHFIVHQNNSEKTKANILSNTRIFYHTPEKFTKHQSGYFSTHQNISSHTKTFYHTPVNFTKHKSEYFLLNRKMCFKRLTKEDWMQASKMYVLGTSNDRGKIRDGSASKKGLNLNLI